MAGVGWAVLTGLEDRPRKADFLYPPGREW